MNSLPADVGCLRSRLPREYGSPFEAHRAVAEPRGFLPEGTSDHLLDVGVALEGCYVGGCGAVGGSPRRHHATVICNRVGCCYCLVRARVREFEHHQVIDSHRVVNIGKVALFGMGFTSGWHIAISSSEGCSKCR